MKEQAGGRKKGAEKEKERWLGLKKETGVQIGDADLRGNDSKKKKVERMDGKKVEVFIETDRQTGVKCLEGKES